MKCDRTRRLVNHDEAIEKFFAKYEYFLDSLNSCYKWSYYYYNIT